MGSHYVAKGMEDHEDYGHKSFDWDGYYVVTDLMGKPFDYDDGDYFEDRYRVDYLEMR